MLGPRIIARNFEPGFFVEHFIKDMGIALDEVEADGHRACRAWRWRISSTWRVQAQGYGRKGTQALMLALETISGIKR